ncbi:MAG: sulfatase [Candidatus Sumerlaeia bacterium]|nr:sulfatase [Candidatus Sumerlaeia bacterium]
MAQWTRRHFLEMALSGAAMTAMPAALSGAAASGGKKMNVLFFAVDDLKPNIGCFGDPIAKTPNLDRIAAKGTIFTRCYCQQAVCSPSRTSLLTGLRPDTTKIYDLETHFRDTIPNVVTLPEQFKKHGYHAQGLSKIYHGGLDDARSWSVPHWAPRTPGYGKPENLELMKRLYAEVKQAGKDPKQRQNQPRGPAWEDADVPDNYFADGATADRAIEVLREIKDKPFFFAVGFLNPHLPFVAPKKYWDLYAPNVFKFAEYREAPKDCPPLAMTSWGELRAYYGIPNQGPLSPEQERSMLHGYYAATSYTDAQVGRVLDELEKLGLADNTIIVLWGDHGWHLGDHGMWCKHTNFEQAARAPLLISVPGQKTAGSRCDRLVEFVDIAPTLMELCGVPLTENLEGLSFKPLIEDPKQPWKKAAFSQYPRGGGKGQAGYMGYSMRTERYRFTEWRPRKGGGEKFYELYDMEKDPLETVNLAAGKANADLVRQLSAMLNAGWKGALPQR